jgi:hypothetical protein
MTGLAEVIPGLSDFLENAAEGLHEVAQGA